MLKEVVPGMSRLGVLAETNPLAAFAFEHYEAAAHAQNMQFLSLEVRGPILITREHSKLRPKGARARLFWLPVRWRQVTERIADLAIKNRLPLMHEGSQHLQAGGLMSYSANEPSFFAVPPPTWTKSLIGAKPADLPVEQPTKFELVINLKTAKQIGLTIPPNVLARADKVIK